MLSSFRIIGLVLLTSWAVEPAMAQEEHFDHITKIVKSGNAKELVKKFGASVELNIDGEEATYSKSQAEAILKDFFDKNPPEKFELNHKGASKSGLPYAIGEMRSGVNVIRVWIRLDKTADKFFVSEMSFIKDD